MPSVRCVSKFPVAEILTPKFVNSSAISRFSLFRVCFLSLIVLCLFLLKTRIRTFVFLWFTVKCHYSQKKNNINCSALINMNLFLNLKYLKLTLKICFLRRLNFMIFCVAYHLQRCFKNVFNTVVYSFSSESSNCSGECFTI